MLWLAKATRSGAIVQLVIGAAVMACSAVYHRELVGRVGGAGYLVGGVLLLGGVWRWFSARHHERSAWEAAQRPPPSIVDPVTAGIPGSAPARTDPWMLVPVALVFVGVVTLPLGILAIVAAGILWWDRRRKRGSDWTPDRVRLFLRPPLPAVGGRLLGEIRLPQEWHPSGPGRVSLAWRRHRRVSRGDRPDRIEEESPAGAVQRLLEADAWQAGTGGWGASVGLPVTGGEPSRGPLPPVTDGEPSVAWHLTLVLPVAGRERTIEFVVPVSAGTAPAEDSDIPPEIAAVAQDFLAPGHPERLAGFMADKVVEARATGTVAEADLNAILQAAGISEVRQEGAVGGSALQMDPRASAAAHGFMNLGVGCAMVMYAAFGVAALAMLLIPRVGWLLSLAGFGVLFWAVRRTLADRRKIDRSPELLWAEPGQLCCRPDRTTTLRVSGAEIDRFEFRWVGTSGDDRYVRIEVARPPAAGAARRERTLLAHSVRGMESARAVVTWLQRRLGIDRPAVEVQPGQEQLDAMHDWIKDPVKR